MPRAAHAGNGNKRLKSREKTAHPLQGRSSAEFKEIGNIALASFRRGTDPSSEKKASNGKLIARHASPKPQAAFTLISAAGFVHVVQTAYSAHPGDRHELYRVAWHLSMSPPTVAKSDVRVGARIPTLLASEGPHFGSLGRSGAVDRARATCYSKLPTFLPPQKVQQVLDACDRTTALGLPDYAVLMILAKLGLRASEAAALNLDDVEAVMHDRLHGKGRRQAMTLLRPRRRNSNRRLYPAWAASFSVPSAISADACGARGFGSGCAITVMAKQALERVVSDGAQHGAHLFSHSLAPDLLLSGASFAAIGQLLCHSSTDCTRIRAKLDFEKLRQPGVAGRSPMTL
ncbi:phage integrase family protein [Sinorhizobium medicae]|nr:phage integrase family protein [Sinorhizobium medicae]TWA33418.1 phage integrase family protein [Sinorhizobium medicae]